MNLIDKTIYVQNASLTHSADVWASCGLPSNSSVTNLVARDTSGNTFPVVVDGQELLVRCPLTAGQKKALVLEYAGSGATPGNRHASRGAPRNVGRASWATTDIQNILPTFRCIWNGTTLTAPEVQMVGQPKINGARARYEFKTRFQTGVPLFVRGWFDVFDNQELVEFKVVMSWGTTGAEGGNNSNSSLTRVMMVVSEQPIIDHRLNKGLPLPTQSGSQWTAVLALPPDWGNQAGLWMKGSGIRITGALRCLPPASEISSATYQDSRYLNTRFRENGSVQAMLSKEDWAGLWGPYGIIPGIEDANARLAESQNFYSHVRGRQDEAPYSQVFQTSNGPVTYYYNGENPTYPFRASNWPYAGTSGGQNDFGATSCLAVIGYNEPGAIHFYNRDLDGWIRRPYIFHETNGEPMAFKNHPNCRTFGHRPNDFYGTDLLGFDLNAPGPYWTSFNEQHSGCNLLFGMYALTRDPSLEATIIGLLTLSLWHFDQERVLPTGSGHQDPRGWGRPMMTGAWAYSVGFRREAKAFLIYCAEKAYERCTYRDPALASKPLKPISYGQSQNGYVYPPGSQNVVFGISPWQESIFMMGAYATWRLGILPEYLQQSMQDIMIAAGRGIRDYMIYEYQGQLMNSWLYSWNTADPGTPWDPSLLWPSYTNQQGQFVENPYVFTYQGGMDWMIPAMQILETFEVTPKSRRIITDMGPSNTSSKAQWWAVTQRTL